MQTPYVSQIPVPDSTAKQRSATNALVERILATKQKNDEADVTAVEQDINRLVYEMYGLSEEGLRGRT